MKCHAYAMNELQQNLRYTFSNSYLLMQALSHSSYASEQNVESNERLEFLGDSLLGAIISSYFFRKHSEFGEGRLTVLRARIVSAKTLSRIAKKLEIGKYLMLGKGEEQTKGREKESNLANALEAIIGAIFLDSNFDTAADAVVNIVKEEIENNLLIENYKGRLQEFCQKQNYHIPVYKIISKEGLEHEKTFMVEVMLKDRVLGRGTGSSKREAEQAAAKRALDSEG